MRKFVVAVSLVGLGMLTLGLGAASAQSPAPGGEAVAATDALEQSRNYVAEMEAVRAYVQGELHRARKGRDIVKILCLDDKLRQIDAAINAAAGLSHELELAAERGDTEAASQRLSLQTVQHKRVMELDAEAKQCIGQETVFIGESEVSVEASPDLPLEEPATYPESPVVIQPPSCLSCNQ